ncbi:Glutathione peroxidase 2 [Mycoemilia scoparia]|uniref:Glutathione peroxidase n=1 Tax=Mycoemilia scoparia TaxID=417184 RepID=A0A9W7ZUU7_9FUNG|nr:Glutathione peroxidase 2 [Mycoemilia scoparia]
MSSTTTTKFNESFYQLHATDNKGEEFEFERLRGKVTIIVNVASKCGLTSQYDDLQKIYDEFQPKGLEILGFPCNQFAGQEPGDSQEIATFCTLRKVTFPIMKKVNVNGKEASPVYVYLKSQASGFITNAIKWNFTKFLIDRHGNVVERYSPDKNPMAFVDRIKELLDENVEPSTL